MIRVTCEDMLVHVSDYLDGEAPADLRAAMEAHLQTCQNCQAMADTLAKTVTLYRELPQPDLPPAARRRLYRTLVLADFLPSRPAD